MTIYAVEPSGATTTNTYVSLEAARTATSAAGKTIVVSHALSATEANISGLWPDDRTLRFVFGGNMVNNTDFCFLNGRRFEAGLFPVFLGVGEIKGLNEVHPEWWGATNSNNAASAMRKAFVCVRSQANPSSGGGGGGGGGSGSPTCPTSSAAIDHADAFGGIIHLSTMYTGDRFDFSSDATDYSTGRVFGTSVKILGNGSKSSGFYGCDNSKVVVDCSGTDGLTFEDCGIQGYGAVAMLRARTVESPTCHNHTTRNLYINGFFGLTAVAVLGAESCNDYSPEWQNRIGENTGYNYVPTLLVSNYNNNSIPMAGKTYLPQSVTDNKVFGGAIRNYSANGVCAKYEDSAHITFFDTMFICGEALGAFLNHYSAPNVGSGGLFTGPVTFHECLFEGGIPGSEASNSNPIAHLLAGKTNDTCEYYYINSFGGWYNQTNSSQPSYLMVEGNPVVLFDSHFERPKINNGHSSPPLIALTAVMRCTFELKSRANNAKIRISAFQGPDVTLSAETVEYSNNNNFDVPITKGSAIPTTGKYGWGHLHLKGVNAVGGSGGLIGWRCWYASDGTYPQGRWEPLYVLTDALPTYANNAAAITGGLAVGAPYRNGDVVQIVH